MSGQTLILIFCCVITGIVGYCEGYRAASPKTTTKKR